MSCKNKKYITPICLYLVRLLAFPNHLCGLQSHLKNSKNFENKVFVLYGSKSLNFSDNESNENGAEVF